MKMYAIRHKPTGHFLPIPKGRRGSRVEPTPDCIPRLFQQERHAKGYLTVWLQGIVSVTRRGYDWDEDEDWHVVPQSHRKRDDMEIVAIKLTPIDDNQKVG